MFLTCHFLIVFVPMLKTCLDVPCSRPDEPSSLQKATKIVIKSDCKVKAPQCDPEMTQGRSLSIFSLLEKQTGVRRRFL